VTENATTNGAQLLTAEELARRWQIKPATVYALARKGTIPTVRFGPRLVRFRLVEVERFEAGGGVSG
jgi:excisionase family DNA binding protein